MTVHAKKCHHASFQAVWDGRKPFEWRREDDCRYEVGDIIILLEWRLDGYERGTLNWHPAGYTGRALRVRVTYVLRGEFGVPEGYAVLGIALERVEQPEDRMTSGIG